MNAPKKVKDLAPKKTVTLNMDELPAMLRIPKKKEQAQIPQHASS